MKRLLCGLTLAALLAVGCGTGENQDGPLPTGEQTAGPTAGAGGGPGGHSGAAHIAEESMPDGHWKFRVEGDAFSGQGGLSATIDSGSGRMVIVEQMELVPTSGSLAGRTLSCRTEVVYANEGGWAPLEAKVETALDGKGALSGSIALDGGIPKLKAKGLIDSKGALVDPPWEIDIAGNQPIEGLLVFQSAVPILGPALVEMASDSKEIVLIRFPDDWFVEANTEFVTFVRPCGLQRAAGGGGSLVEVKDRAGRSILAAHYDGTGQLESIDHPLRIRLVKQ